MDNFIYQTVNDNVSGKSGIASSCFYCEIFQGGLYDFHAKNKTTFSPNNGYDIITATKMRGETEVSYSVERSDVSLWTKFSPISFQKNFSVGQSKTINFTLPYNMFSYNMSTGIFTGNNDLTNFNFTLSKGYLVRLYSGFFSDDNTAAIYQDDNGQHTERQFTGVITDIQVSEDDGTLTIAASDYSVIFLNQLNYNYPDIVSYRDAAEDTEDVIVGGSTYKSPIRIQPDNLFADIANQQFIPAYDNWKVIDAIKDICIKSNFPVERIAFGFMNSDKIRLGKSKEYPFMKTQSKYIQTTATTIEEVVKISGIDAESLDDAKYKFDFGKNLWDCLSTICEDFGFRMFFDKDGKLNIKDVGVGTFYQDFTGTELQIIENNVYGWTAQDLTNYTNCTIKTSISGYKIEARFISKDAELPATTVRVYYNSNLLATVNVRALSKYDAETVTLFESDSPSGLFYFQCADTAYLNCLYYYTPEQQNNPIITLDTTKNVKITQSNLSNQEIRNQVISIGKPNASEPLISKSIDFTSIYGGENIISSLEFSNGIDAVSESKGDFLSNGKKDKYENVIFNPSSFTIKCDGSKPSPKILKIYFKQDSTYIGKTITINTTDSTFSQTISQYDLTNFGMFINIPTITTKVNGKYVIQLSCASAQSFYLSEVECFNNDISYNYAGFLKELMIVKDNVSDKSSNDWAAKTLIETHRGNSHQVEAEAIGMPFLNIGDCIDIYAPELGFAQDKNFYVTGISDSGTDISYTSKISLSAIPPVKSIQWMPDIDETKFTGDIYDFTIQIKEKDNVSGDAKGIIGGEFENISGLPGDMKNFKHGRMIAYDSVNGKIYALGGSSTWMTDTWITRMTPTKYFAIYDISTKTWTQGSMPVATCFGFACCYNGDLYVFGGTNNAANILKYTFSTSTWSNYGSLSFNFQYGGAAIKDNMVYLISGWSGSSSEYPVGGCYSYDILTKTITTLATLNSSNGYFLNQCCLSYDGNYIYSLGGSYRDYQLPGPDEYTWDWHNRLYLSRNLNRYNISSNTWESLTAPLVGIAGGTLQTDSTGIYVFGGYRVDGSGFYSSNSAHKIYDYSTGYVFEPYGGVPESFGISGCIYGSKFLIAGEGVYSIDLVKMKVSQAIDIKPITDYCLFSFATTKRRKISVLVKHPSKNEIYAWPLEETIIEPGVYKRENGIRWDFGLDFEQRFGDFCDKIFLYPNDSDDNYVYSTIYEDLEITSEYDPTVTHKRTPPFYIVRLNVKLDKYLLNTLGSATISSDIQMDVPIITHSDMYKDGAFKLAIEDVFPSQVQVGGSVIAPLSVKKNNITLILNDMVYVDVIVQRNDGANVNQITQSVDEYGRYPNSAQRNVITAALIDEIKWDLTDSSGIYVPINSKYKFKIINAFGVNGEAVIFTTATSDNILPNPIFKPISTTNTVTTTKQSLNGSVSSSTSVVTTKIMKDWVYNDSFVSLFDITPSKYYSWQESIQVPKTLPNGTVIGNTTTIITKTLTNKSFGYNITMDTDKERVSTTFDQLGTISFKKEFSGNTSNIFAGALMDVELGTNDIEKVTSEYLNDSPHVKSTKAYIANPEVSQDIYVSFEYLLYSPIRTGYPSGELTFVDKNGQTVSYVDLSISEAIKKYCLAPVFFVAYKTDKLSYKIVKSDMIKLTPSSNPEGTMSVAGTKFTIPKATDCSEIDLIVGVKFGDSFKLTRTSNDPPGKPSGYVANLFSSDPELYYFVDYAKTQSFNPGINLYFDNFQTILGSEYRKITYSEQPKDNAKTSGIFEVI